ncbi:MAG TPA: YlxR family protein [Clostridia bacterium]|nr:YlxR family protein [Clostridia bacterium]
MARVKKIPMRMCVGCRERKEKRQLVRIVRTPEGTVLVDPTGKKSGRGAYICPDVTCLEKVIKNKGLERALEVTIEPHVVEELRQQLGQVSLGEN